MAATVNVSNAASPKAVISAGSAEAAQTGAAVLEAGGNAVDAVIAASAVQCVRELPWCGLGGDGFAMVSNPDGTLEALNGAGAAPRALSTASLNADRLPRFGPLSISTPGLVHAWGCLWEHDGTWDWTALFEPAIELAQRGFILDEAFAAALNRTKTQVGAGDPLVHELCADNKAAAGERFRLPTLARTLSLIASAGPDVFYRGPLGRELTEVIRRRGGLLAAEDLQNHTAGFVAPLSIRYRGAVVSVTPPVSMGWVLLQQMLLLERLSDGDRSDQADLVDLMVRCKHAAFDDLTGLQRWQDAADVMALLDNDAVQQRAALIAAERAAGQPPRPDARVKASAAPTNNGSNATGNSAPGFSEASVRAAAMGSDTTCLAVADTEGRLVTFIHSLFNEFGSRVVVPGTGIVLNDRLAKQPTSMARSNGPPGSSRPLHTLVGYHLQHGGLRLVGATPGGRGQVQTNFQVLRSIIDDDATVQHAVQRPRWLSGAPRLPDADDLLLLEEGFSAGVRSELAKRGHQVATRADTSSDLFGSCTIAAVHADTGQQSAVADHRRRASMVEVHP